MFDCSLVINLSSPVFLSSVIVICPTIKDVITDVREKQIMNAK